MLPTAPTDSQGFWLYRKDNLLHKVKKPRGAVGAVGNIYENKSDFKEKVQYFSLFGKKMEEKNK